MDAVYVISPFWIDYKKPSPHDVLSKSSSTAPTATTTSPSTPTANIGISLSPPESSPYAPKNLAHSGMPSPTLLLDRYAQITNFDPRLEGTPPGRDFEIAKVFHNVRGGTISHGIQARTYAGQASSDFSHVYFENTRKSLDRAWEMVRRLKGEGGQGRARL